MAYYRNSFFCMQKEKDRLLAYFTTTVMFLGDFGMNVYQKGDILIPISLISLKASVQYFLQGFY